MSSHIIVTKCASQGTHFIFKISFSQKSQINTIKAANNATEKKSLDGKILAIDSKDNN